MACKKPLKNNNKNSQHLSIIFFKLHRGSKPQFHNVFLSMGIFSNASLGLTNCTLKQFWFCASTRDSGGYFRSSLAKWSEILYNIESKLIHSHLSCTNIILKIKGFFFPWYILSQCSYKKPLYPLLTFHS